MKTLFALLIAAIAALVAVPTFAAPRIVTLETLQVRPSAEQVAQRLFEQRSGIATLAAVQVRPSTAQLGERDAAPADRQRVVTLATVQVRPDADLGTLLAIGDAVGDALDRALPQLQPGLRKPGQELAGGPAH